MHSSRTVTAGCRIALASALLVAAAVLAGCSTSSTPIVPTTPLSRVTITPAVDSLIAGHFRVFTAAAYDTNDVVVNGMAIAWRSAEPAIASVNNNGRVTAISEGLAHIIASAGNKADTATVYVTGTATGWIVQTSGTIQDLFGVFFQPDGRTGYAVGATGTLRVTTDAGATWTPGTSGTGFDLHSVWFTSADTGWAVGVGGTLMKTVNAGVNWTRQGNLATSATLMCVRFSDPQHGWIVGAGGLIARTRDRGANWTITIPFGWQLNSVSFGDSLNGWLAGANGTVMGSHDGGKSWYSVSLGVSSQTFRGISRADDSVTVAVGTQGTIAHTEATPDSLDWSVTSVGAGNALEAVWMTDAYYGWAVGSNPNGLILTTDDGGMSWSPQVAGVSQVLRAVQFVDPLRGWIVGDGGRILHTSHGGH